MAQWRGTRGRLREELELAKEAALVAEHKAAAEQRRSGLKGGTARSLMLPFVARRCLSWPQGRAKSQIGCLACRQKAVRDAVEAVEQIAKAAQVFLTHA